MTRNKQIFMLTLQGIVEWSMLCRACIAACHATQSFASDAKHSEACASGHKAQSSDESQGKTFCREACAARQSEQVGHSSSTPGWDWRDRRWLPDIPCDKITPIGSDRSYSPLFDIPPEGMGGWIKQLGHGMSRVQEVTAAAMQPLSSQAQMSPKPNSSLIAALQKLQCTDLDSVTEAAMLSSPKPSCLLPDAPCGRL